LEQDGAYQTSIDILKNQTLTHSNFIFTQIPADTNFYRVNSIKKSLKKLLKSNQIWGIIQDSTLYINCIRLGMKKRYVKVQEAGRYCYVIAEPIISPEQKASVARNAAMFGLVGGTVSNLVVKKQNEDKDHFLIDLQYGIPHLASKRYIEHLLSDHKELLDKFNEEPKNDSRPVFLKYLKLLNDKFL